MASTFKPLFVGNVRLFAFWSTNNFTLFNELPPEMKHLGTLRTKMANKQPFEVKVNKSLIDRYNNGMKQLGDDLHAEYHATTKPRSFFQRQVSFFIVRAMTVIAAMFSFNPLLHSFLVSLFQFLVLPYSLFVSIGYGIETSLVLFTGHLLVFPCIKYAVDTVCPSQYNPIIEFSPLFLTMFLALDQLICALCLYRTPKGKTKAVSAARVFESVWYGFLNCKTYYLVLVPLLFGDRGGGIPVIPWLIDAVFGLSAFVSSYVGGYWELFFYHVHRMGHIRNVYPDAHKFHHYLRDSTAFDAHIFGSGAPEEWLMIFVEYAIALVCGGCPPSMSYHVLTVSWYNKWGFHSRADLPEYHWRNFHADHHTKHDVHFGFEYPLEMLMKTTSNRDHVFNGYQIKRNETDHEIVLKFTPCKQE